LGGRALGGGGAGRAVALALVSTVVVLGVVVYGVTHAPNWPEVKASFFDWDVYKSSFPGIALPDGIRARTGPSTPSTRVLISQST